MYLILCSLSFTESISTFPVKYETSKKKSVLYLKQIGAMTTKNKYIGNFIFKVSTCTILC